MKTDDPGVTRELLVGAQAGDAAAMDALLRRYTPFVLRVVGLRMGQPLRNVLEREDLVQERDRLALGTLRDALLIRGIWSEPMIRYEPAPVPGEGSVAPIGPGGRPPVERVSPDKG